MSVFNPLLESKVNQFDAKHGEAVPDDEGSWLIYQDGSSRKITPGHFDFIEAADQPPDVTAKWRKFWHRKMIPLLAERFRRQQEIALNATGDDAERELKALRTLHDQLVSIKRALDDLTQVNVPCKPVDYATWFDCRPAGVLPEGVTPLSMLERQLADLERSCAALRRDVYVLKAVPAGTEAMQSNRIASWEGRLEAREARLEPLREAIRLQREWEAKPLDERLAIATAKLEVARDDWQREEAARKKHVEAVQRMTVPFVEDADLPLTDEQRRLAAEREHAATLRHETNDFLDRRMAAKESRLRPSDAEADEDADERPARPLKTKPSKAKRR
jgi:hypothetical protein